MNKLQGRFSTATVVAFTLFLLGAGRAFAAEYFVDFAAGLDTNAGTSQSAPWKHAPGDPTAAGQPAAKALLPGDIVTFHGGVPYLGSITITRSGTASQPVVYRGGSWGTSLAIIDGENTRDIGFTISANYVRVEGFEVRNETAYGIRHDSPANGAGLAFVNNRIHNIGPWPTAAPEPSGGAMYMRYTQNLLVQDSEHYYTAGDALRVFDSTDAVIRNNNFHDGQVDGIMGGSNGTLTIDSNTLHGFTNIARHGDATQIMQGDIVIISNNLVYDSTQNIYFDTYLSGFTALYIYNNLVVNTVPGADGQGGWYNGIVIDNRYNPIGEVYVYENTLVNLNTGSGGFTNMSAGGNLIGTVAIRNNIFHNSVNNVDTTTITNLSMDYNDYYNTFQSWVFFVGRLTFAQFRAAYPLLEQHSIVTNPSRYGTGGGERRVIRPGLQPCRPSGGRRVGHGRLRGRRHGGHRACCAHGTARRSLNVDDQK